MEKAEDQDQQQRAWLPDSHVIDGRRLASSHQRLAQLLHNNMMVLDVGCGTGTITSDILDHVGEGGQVTGIDYNATFIAQAQALARDRENLVFDCMSVYELPDEHPFDLVTAARVIQWLDDPQVALGKMVRALKPGGTLLILDYNHLRVQFLPPLPLLAQQFYQRFLDWRADAGYINDVADRLSEWLIEAGLTHIVITPQHEHNTASSEAGYAGMRIWADVMRIRGAQMVADGYWNQADLEEVEQRYTQWLEEEAQSMTLYLLAVEGKRSVIPLHNIVND